MFGPIQNGGTKTVQLVGDDTVIIDQGQIKGRIQDSRTQPSTVLLVGMGWRKGRLSGPQGGLVG